MWACDDWENTRAKCAKLAHTRSHSLKACSKLAQSLLKACSKLAWSPEAATRDWENTR